MVLAAAPLEAAFETVALVMHRGLGQERASQLGRLGIRSRADLARWSPAELARRLREQGQSPRDRFLERRARVWVGGGAESKMTSSKEAPCRWIVVVSS